MAKPVWKSKRKAFTTPGGEMITDEAAVRLVPERVARSIVGKVNASKPRAYRGGSSKPYVYRPGGGRKRTHHHRANDPDCSCVTCRNVRGPRWWISWSQPTQDYRPVNWPASDEILGYWCVSQKIGEGATICALINARQEAPAKAAIRREWPEAREWKCIEEKERDWLPDQDRFPLSDWMLERVARKTA